MILALMTLALFVGACLALSALAAERIVLTRRGAAVRWIWLAAMVLTIAIPVIRLLAATDDRRAPAAAAPIARPAVPVVAVRDAPQTAPLVEKGPGASSFRVRAVALRDSVFVLPAVPAAAQRMLVTSWCVASASLALVVLGSLVRLHRDTRRWQRMIVHDTPVLVSDGLGPALVGLYRPVIVVPPWVLALDDATTRTILTHEHAHRRAGDTWVLAVAGLLVIAMPWHALLWWMRHRLLRAVEFDCDARVVAGGIRRATYADHLLRAWQHASSARRVTLAAAFIERSSELGQRVNHMLRPTPRRSGMLRVSGVTAALLFGAAAIAAPTPHVAQRARFERNASEQAKLAARPRVHEIAEPAVWYTYFGNSLPPDHAIAKTIARVEQSYAEELALYARTPSDTARVRRLREHRMDAVRAVLDSADKRWALDRRGPLSQPKFRPR